MNYLLKICHLKRTVGDYNTDNKKRGGETMKAKKLVSILLAGTMVFSLAACGNQSSENSEGEGGDASGEKTTIRILWPETDSTQVDVMDNYLKPALAEKFPDVEFEYIPMTADSPVKTMSASGDLPEIFFTGGADLEAVLGAGDALDLAPYLGDGWVEEHYTDPSQLYIDDSIYFLISGQNEYYTPVFYYNTALFEQYGIQEPQTIDDLVAACQKFVDNGITPITTTSFMAQYSLIDGLLESAAPDALIGLHQRTCDWTDERVVKALSYFDELKLMGAFAPDLATKDDATALSEFQSGNTAMWLTYSWSNYDVTEENLGFVPGTFNFPAAEGEDYIQLHFSGRKGYGGGYTVNSKVEDPQLATDILKVITEAESNRHAANGLGTNFKVENAAEPTNPLEVERMEAYNSAPMKYGVLCQTSMDGVTLAEFGTLFNMLISADQGYLSSNFIEEFNPIWEQNTYPAEE